MSTNNNNIIVKNTVYMTAQMVLGLMVSLYTSRVVLQTLGVDDFGIYNVVAGFVSMFAFLNGTLINGTQRFYNYELGKKGEEGACAVFNASIRIQAIMSILLLIVVESVGLWYLNNRMVIPEERLFAANWVFQLSIASMVIIIMQVPYGAAIMAHERMGFYALVNLIDVFLKLAVVLVLPVFVGDKLIVYVFLLLLITIVNFILNFVYSAKHFKEIQLRKLALGSLFKEMLTFSGWNAFGAFSNMAQGQGINMILNLFFGPVINAARGIAFQVNGAMQGLVSNVAVAIKPQLTQSYAQENYIRVFSLMNSMSKISTLVLYALSLPLLIEIPYVLHIWLGDVVPEYTGIFTIIVVLTSLLDNLNAPISFVVHATGRMSKYQVICSLITLLSLPLSFFALKMGYSPVVVFLIVMLISAIKQVAALFILRTLIDFSIVKYFKAVLLPLLVFILTTLFLPFVPHILMNQSFLRLIVVILVSECVILPSAYIVLLDKSEKLIVMQYVGKMKHIFKQ